ncbi:carboxylesterase/lipase family protein [Rhodococcus sp. ABRD24]|uniref:carboxylesterase/lipase family protein n=1 Tax=Rhodococcus sp. ABRD24 TaxID=2507582 RepID=UPI0010393AD8|nr:carboxylesterase/lipase family protein [Rhodococcus sp. ABRD24]QBJ96619.1 carboxylesterase/lipase family protein [Rhodococcus sp. ABRD24]
MTLTGNNTDTVPVVQTSYGPVRGTIDGPVAVWKGIRFAAAPTGGRRFQAPVAPEPWTDIFEANRFGPVCPQSPMPGMPLGVDIQKHEDCLSLNVWSPGSLDKPKPVMVWIHGGAYFRGASSQPLYDGRSLAENGDVVVVTMNYRLGVLGFVDFSSLNTEEHRFDPNVALQDMIAALRWVRDNITAFGGDPDSVTLFGESAGGGAVTTLMTMPSARGLFHRAIAESSPATSVYNSERAAHVANTFLEILGGADDPVERLLTATSDELLTASDALFARIPSETPGTLAFGPIVDGELVPDYPVNAFWNGTAMRIPLLIGTNKDESSLFQIMKSPLMPVDPAVIRAMFDEIAAEHPDLELPDQARIESAYSGLATKSDAMGLTRDFGFRLPTLWIVEAHSQYAPTWLYRFDYATPMLKALKIGATHATELPYVFGNIAHGPKEITYKLGGLSTGRKVSARMQQRWLAFAKYAVPVGLDGEPQWDAYNRENRATLVIDKHDTVVRDLDGPLREAWGEQVIAFT